MKINVVLYESKGWIIDKFAHEIVNNLKGKGLDVVLTSRPIDGVDVYHHLLYYNVDRSDFSKYNNALHSVMVTHLDTVKKVNKVLSIGAKRNTLLITMSRYYTEGLVRLGINYNNVKTIIAPKNEICSSRTKIRIGIFSNFYDDGRKNEQWLIDALYYNERFSDILEVMIYGSGWNKVENLLKNRGFNVLVYDKSFNDLEYDELLDKIDYYMYLGRDEGSMSFLDAIAKGKKVIAIPQGFQHDFIAYISHPVNSVNDLERVIENICLRQERINFMICYKWSDYTSDLLNLWLKKLNEPNYRYSTLNRVRSKLLYQLNVKSVYKRFGVK